MLRPWHPGDRAFIVDSWLSSFRQSHWRGPIKDSRYRDVYGSVVDELLDTAGTRVLVDHNPEDKEQIFGWACYTITDGIPTLHYCYVKAPYRDARGQPQADQPHVAIKLLRDIRAADGCRVNFTFRTPQWDKFRTRWRLNAHFAPELLTKDRKAA